MSDHAIGSAAPKKKDFTTICDEIENDDCNYLIRRDDLYIVYLDKAPDVEWVTSEEYDKKGPGDRSQHNAVLSAAAVLECTPLQGLEPQTIMQFKRLLGEAVVCSIEHDYLNASRTLVEAKAYIRARSEEMSRRWYLSASITSAAIMFMLGGAAWIYREPLKVLLSEDAVFLFIAAVAGSGGALLSVIWRSGDLKFDCSAGWVLHYLEAASRICAGALSGVVALLAVKSEFVLSALSHGTNPTTVTMLAAFVSGTSERLATSIISRFDTTHPANIEPRSKDKEEGEIPK